MYVTCANCSRLMSTSGPVSRDAVFFFRPRLGLSGRSFGRTRPRVSMNNLKMLELLSVSVSTMRKAPELLSVRCETPVSLQREHGHCCRENHVVDSNYMRLTVSSQEGADSGAQGGLPGTRRRLLEAHRCGRFMLLSA